MPDNNFAFIPGMPPVSPPSTSRKSSSPTLINSQIVAIDPKGQQNMNRLSQVKQGWDMLPPSAKEQIAAKASDTIKGVFKSGGSGDTPNSSGYSLTHAPNPKSVQLDTGVKPNTYTSDYLDPVENVCAPLHVTHAKFLFPQNAGTRLYNYLATHSAFDIQIQAQINVTYNIDLTAFSASNILGTLNNVATALQVYFYYRSIVSYHSNPTNKNAGMIYLRSIMTPNTIELLTQLGRILADTPCPPKMLELIRYLSGNFLSGQTAESPMLIISPLTPTETGSDDAAISAALAGLDTANTRLVLTVLRKAIPHWSPKVLYDVDSIPMFDRNFLTIFQNLPFTYFRTATYTRVPTIATDTLPIKYNTYTSELDGAAFALVGAYSSTQTLWLPSLMTPTGSSGAITGNSRTSYYTVGGVTKFWPSDLDNYLSRSRNSTYQINDAFTTILTPHTLGTNMCQNVTVDAIRETCNDLVDYLIAAETIKMDIKKFHFGSSKSSNDSSRRTRNKKKAS